MDMNEVRRVLRDVAYTNERSWGYRAAQALEFCVEQLEKLGAEKDEASNEWWYSSKGHLPDTNVDAYYVNQGKSRISGRMHFHEAITLVAIHNRLIKALAGRDTLASAVREANNRTAEVLDLREQLQALQTVSRRQAEELDKANQEMQQCWNLLNEAKPECVAPTFQLPNAVKWMLDELAALRVPFSNEVIEKMAREASYGIGGWGYDNWDKGIMRDTWRVSVRRALAAGGIEPCAKAGANTYDLDALAAEARLIFLQAPASGPAPVPWGCLKDGLKDGWRSVVTFLRGAQPDQTIPDVEDARKEQ